MKGANQPRPGHALKLPATLLQQKRGQYVEARAFLDSVRILTEAGVGLTQGRVIKLAKAITEHGCVGVEMRAHGTPNQETMMRKHGGSCWLIGTVVGPPRQDIWVVPVEEGEANQGVTR